MKHLIAIDIASNFPKFEGCLKSLVDSDYTGDILVLEDGILPYDTTYEVCSRLGVRRVKFDKPAFVSDQFNYIDTLCDDYDIITISHSDNLYPPVWFDTLEVAWECLMEYDKVLCLNLNIEDIDSGKRSMEGIQRFELGLDYWNNGYCGIKQLGRHSPVISHPAKYFKLLDHAKVEYTLLHELNCLLYMIDHRMWLIYLNTPIIKHIREADTKSNSIVGVAWGATSRNSYRVWIERYGIGLECTLWYWFSNILVNHQEEIVEAINRYDFDSIDYIFDEFYVGWGDCDTCGIRDRCPWKYKNKDINNPGGN